jgi:hypothetical protein
MSNGNDMNVHTSNEPRDRLTRLCAQMTSVLDEPEHADVKAIVFLTDQDRSGIQMSGYDDTTEGLADLLVHMKAMFQSMGKDLEFIGIPESPGGLGS